MRLGWQLADCCPDRNQAVVVRRYVEDLAFVIDGTRQIHPLAGDGNDHLIQVPPPREEVRGGIRQPPLGNRRPSGRKLMTGAPLGRAGGKPQRNCTSSTPCSRR